MQVVALLYAARLHVCLNRVDDAVPLFSRAWTLSLGTELEPEALICLCSAYAYLDNPMNASRLLVENRDVLQDVEHYHDLAAFIGCHCRYSLAQSADRRMRDGQELLNALAHVDPERFFSLQGWSLVVHDYHKLGLDQESQSTLQLCLVACEDCLFRDEMVRGEAMDQAASGQANANEFADISAMLGDVTLHRLELMKSQLSQGEHAALRSQAEDLLSHQLSAEMRDEVFDLLGLSYQRDGEHYLAALCFARINPFSERAHQLRDSFFQEWAADTGDTAP
jgi:hypothetical protein